MVQQTTIQVTCYKVSYFEGGGESQEIATDTIGSQEQLEEFQNVCNDLAEAEADECDISYELYFEVELFLNNL